MCGEHVLMSETTPTSPGSSPHVRGAPRLTGMYGEIHGIIPACAGSTDYRQVFDRYSRDHPRMCGEHEVESFQVEKAKGSSPHVRGAHRWRQVHPSRLGIIPACAGSTRFALMTTCVKGDHPRMCGEHRVIPDQLWQSTGSSPHVRGAQRRFLGECRFAGIIPACAGSTLRK